jgi:hypothetical protein
MRGMEGNIHGVEAESGRSLHFEPPRTAAVRIERDKQVNDLGIGSY